MNVYVLHSIAHTVGKPSPGSSQIACRTASIWINRRSIFSMCDLFYNQLSVSGFWSLRQLSKRGYYLNQNKSHFCSVAFQFCVSAKSQRWMGDYYANLTFVNPNLFFFSYNSNPWLFLESTVPGWAVTISHVPLTASSSSSSSPQKWQCVFVLCSVNVFVKKMRVHDLAIPPVTSNLTAQPTRPPPHTQRERAAFSAREGYVIGPDFKTWMRGQGRISIYLFRC